jgi:fructose/tagatose bisphosphate aldolase
MDSKRIDELARISAFGNDSEKQEARFEIWNTAQEMGILPASINDLYMARGRGEIPADFSVPAMNLRGMAYDMAWTVFKVAKKRNVGALICELARSEMGYTGQPPSEYASVVLAGAIKSGWSGPVFIQCDHFTVKEEGPGTPKGGEIETLRKLIEEAVRSGFYNVDIDMSTLVDLGKKAVTDQQEFNVKYSVEMAKHVRSLEPKGIRISLGGEIGHIGGVNSTVEDFRAFIDGFNKGIGGMEGISKVAVQTGSSHGGVVLPDGSLADVEVDFSILKNISKVARNEFQIGGPVQHGASTLPEEYFSEFVKNEALEVHLATGFQNTQMDHPEFPQDLRKKIYEWLDSDLTEEKKEDQTVDQFHYKLRKKGWGRFKKETWDIPETSKAAIRDSLAERFEFLFQQLNVIDTADLVSKFVKPISISKPKNDFSLTPPEDPNEVKGLAD